MQLHKFNLLWWLCILTMVQCKPDTARIETNFRISNPNQIDRIEIFEKNTIKQSLYRIGSAWYLNDSTSVRPDAMENIIRILPSIKVMFYPPRAAWENMVTAINQEGVTVVFKDKKNQVIKTWHIGGLTNDERGTYAMIDGSTQPYVVHVPGFEGSLASRFNMTDEDWRDRMMFKVTPNEILAIAIEYPQDPSENFALWYDQTSGTYLLSNPVGKPIAVTKGQALNYLEVFQHIGAESIANNFQHKAIVLSSIPHAIIHIEITGKPKRIVKFYTMQSVGEPGMDRMFVYDGRDFFLAQLRILQKLFRGRTFFLAK